jgi:Bacterial Ig-like domain
MTKRSLLCGPIFMASLLVATGCGTEPTGPAASAELASVVPAGGTINVDVGTFVVVTFTHSMMVGMEDYMVLHKGDVTGPLVAGTWSWSEDRLQTTFHPSSPLEPKTLYTIHVGGGMMDEDGDEVGFNHYGHQMGGVRATGQMMSGGMMGGSTGSMMGQGWRGADGMYGMVFSFTTA